MDSSALETTSKALENSLDSWGLLILLSTAIVVVGLIVEYRDEAAEFWTLCRWPMASFPWHKFRGLFGGILVTVGVAGELFFTYRASRVESSLRENNRKIIASLKDQASANNLKAEQLRKEGDQLRKDAEELREQNIANERALEEERTARLELKAKVAWRTVSVEQVKILKHQLQSVRGQSIVVRWETVDPEQDNFGSQLADALGNAGLAVSRVMTSVMSTLPWQKIPSLSLEDVTKDNSDLADVLEHALVVASLAKSPIPRMPPGSVTMGGRGLKVVVGPRSPI